jgi:hypothetical protein
MRNKARLPAAARLGLYTRSTPLRGSVDQGRLPLEACRKRKNHRQNQKDGKYGNEDLQHSGALLILKLI